MKEPFGNPYLPLTEYVPDGEPHLFDGRVYLYGSHDTPNGTFFCTEDYVVWSAPERDLTDWRCEGVSYRRSQDPSNADGSRELFAPDVVRGPDGRYYLYYCLRMVQEFGVAVSDTPAGPFSFYGHVHLPDGTVYARYMPYDPSVLQDDDGRIYLYYGFSSAMLAERFHAEVSPGAMVIELAPDMLTVLSEPKCCIPWEGRAAGTGFAGHAYFEAPSMRKIDGRYYLVYSSQWCHELCYAVSDRPTEGFVYGGVIVDNADIGWQGRTVPVCIPGNNHGGLVRAAGKDYIFYHRHTNANSFSRQGCAEKVTFLADGSLPQVPITSSGLRGAPLPAQGHWPAALACILYGRCPEQMLDFRNVDPAAIPYLSQRNEANGTTILPICNMQDGTTAGYRDFRGSGTYRLTSFLRGEGEGRLEARLDDADSTPTAQADVSLQGEGWQPISLELELNGRHALYLTYRGTGTLSFRDFLWESRP